LAKVGVNSAIGKASGDNRDPFTERDRIILAYQGFSDPLEISKRLSHIWADVNLDSATAIKRAWFASFESTIRRQQERTSRIVEIQKQHHVSGLEELEVNIADRLVRFHCPHEQLAVLAHDLEIMYSERMTIAREFVNATRRYRMELYQRHDADKSSEWIQVKPKSVLLDAWRHACVNLWVDKKYVNYSELHENGYANLKIHPETAADEVSLEFHLAASTRANFHSKSESKDVWYCARMGRGKPLV